MWGGLLIISYCYFPTSFPILYFYLDDNHLPDHIYLDKKRIKLDLAFSDSTCNVKTLKECRYLRLCLFFFLSVCFLHLWPLFAEDSTGNV